MGYYVVKVYGLTCDNCGASVECVPPIDARGKLAAARRELANGPDGWTYRDGRDLCKKCKATKEGAPPVGGEVEHGLNISSGSWRCKCGEYNCPKAAPPYRRRPPACPVHGAVLDCADDCEGRAAAVS